MSTRSRAADWALFLARVSACGFTVRDGGADKVIVTREGRESYIDLAGVVRYSASDPRDAFLLSLALENDARWAAREVYFVLPPNGREPVPAEYRLHASDGEVVFEDDRLDGRCERTVIAGREQLEDLLLYLAAPNVIGYHRARARILGAYERLRPTTWEELRLDAGDIALYRRHRVQPGEVRDALAGGVRERNRIIAMYGVPPDDEWTPVCCRR